jgi:uncharacterized protein
MLIRVLLLLGLVLALMWWFGKGRRREARDDGEGREPPPPAAAGGAPAPQAMVRCAHCGLHLPQADALAGADDRPYCSEAHRLQGPGQEPPP